MIDSYFQAEKQGGQVLLSLGITACSIGGGILLSAGAPFYTGLAIPLTIIGFVQIMVGATVARRSESQAEDLKKRLAESPAEFRETEEQRMLAVMTNFLRIKWLEVVFIVLGLAIILVNKDITFTKGLGAGLFGQGALMLIFDLIAEKRSKAYLDFVRKH